MRGEYPKFNISLLCGLIPFSVLMLCAGYYIGLLLEFPTMEKHQSSSAHRSIRAAPEQVRVISVPGGVEMLLFYADGKPVMVSDHINLGEETTYVAKTVGAK